MSQVQHFNETEDVLKSSFRTMAIFECFADARKPLTISGICQRLKIPQSSTSTLIRSLVDTGYLAFDRNTRAYAPTLRLHMLTSWSSEKSAVATKLSEGLKVLQKQTGLTAVIAMRNGIYSQYILVEHGENIIRKHVETGSVRPLVCSATGWSMLASESDIEIGKLIRTTKLRVDNERWIASADNAHESIEEARNQQYAYSRGNAAKNASGIAIDLPSTQSIRQLSLSIAGPSDNISEGLNSIISAMKNFVMTLDADITEQILKPF